MFLGQLNDRPAIVIALFGEHGLTKVLVSLPTEEGSTMDVYREMRKVLGGEYGSPALEVERYAYPFANGHHVGFEMAALRTGKATIGAKWQTNGENLGIKITEGPDRGGPLRIARLGRSTPNAAASSAAATAAAAAADGRPPPSSHGAAARSPAVYSTLFTGFRVCSDRLRAGVRAPAGGVWWQATTTVAISRGGSSRQRWARSRVSRQGRTC